MNCYWPSYGYGFGNYAPDYSSGNQTAPPTSTYSDEPYGRAQLGLTELYLKDGTVYDVTDYWLQDGKVHFQARDGAIEQVIGIDVLDLQTTVNVNTRRGLQFVLRNEPAE